MWPVLPKPNCVTESSKILAKNTKNGQNDPKIAQNGLKQSEMLRKIVQMRPVIPTPNCPTENGEKLPKNYRKIAKMTLKWPKMA